MAARDLSRALELARSIADPWFRCQALSSVALHASDRRTRERAIDEALASAHELSDPNRIVTASAWPVKVLVLSGNVKRAETEAARLLEVIASEGSPVRRADALRYLLGAVVTAGPRIAGRIADRFAAACLAPLHSGKRNRKGESHLEECVPAIARIDQALAVTLLRRLPPDRARRAQRAIETSKGAPLAEMLPWPNLDIA